MNVALLCPFRGLHCPFRGQPVSERTSASAPPTTATAAASGPKPAKPKLPIIHPPRAAALSQPMLLDVTFSPITVPRTCSGTSASDAISDGRAMALKNT